MAIDNGLLQKDAGQHPYHTAVRVGARILSYVFHPLFVPIYVVIFFLYEAMLMPERTGGARLFIIIQYFVSYTFLPLATILIMRKLGFIESIHLRTRKDRILPYVVCEIFYFWAWYVSKNLFYPKEFIVFGLAVFIATSLALILNAYMKISMHAISVGVTIGVLAFCSLRTDMNYGLYLSIGLLIAGLTCTARLIDSDHTSKEIYAGLLTGFIAIAAAWMFV
ncbi:MAG TPA: hypothetical protein VFR58_02055 [Flavisolibacter sp.]|nr:hypothetical protein [Flavisolibacter sp.]